MLHPAIPLSEAGLECRALGIKRNQCHLDFNLGREKELAVPNKRRVANNPRQQKYRDPYTHHKQCPAHR
jgi:hypothetical protein